MGSSHHGGGEMRLYFFAPQILRKICQASTETGPAPMARRSRRPGQRLRPQMQRAESPNRPLTVFAMLGHAPPANSPPLSGKSFAIPRLALMLALGFSSGLPFLLIFSTQSAWLREAGVSRSAIGLMSYCALAFTFKFAWAPFIDRVRSAAARRAGSGGGAAGCCSRRSASRSGLAGLAFGAPAQIARPGASASPSSPPSPPRRRT